MDEHQHLLRWEAVLQTTSSSLYWHIQSNTLWCQWWMIKTQKGANYGWTIRGSTRRGLGVCSTFGAASCLLLQACKHVLLSTYQQLVSCASILSIALLIHLSCMYCKHQPAQNIHYYFLFWEPLSRRAIDYLQCHQCNTKHSTTDKPTAASQ